MIKKITVASIVGFLVLSAMSPGALSAPSVNIEGTVKDAQTGEALPGANVTIPKTSMGASTDIYGKYIIRNVSPGTYTLRATYIGYKEKDVTIIVKEGENLKQDFRLSGVAVEGEEVVVTAQAVGQNEAINQQLSSMQIKNVVSSARIQELPDANAAESVGRLPGVSVTRDGGEGSKVVIRGLAPKYNVITIDGVRMAPTDIDDRSVDLGMISPYMLEGIEVMKAITPDQDADALGGTVNFKMKEAKDVGMGVKDEFGVGEPGSTISIDAIAQGGYNKLKNSYSDYKFVGVASTRFLDNRLGVLVQGDFERRNRSSNELGASYNLRGPELLKVNPVYLGGLNLADIMRDKQRVGGTVVVDYRLPAGKINTTNFFSFSDTKSNNRAESYNWAGNSKEYSTTEVRSKLNVVTNILKYEQDLSDLKFDVKLSHTFSENQTPDYYNYYFTQPAVGVSNANPQMGPQSIPPFARINLRETYLQSISEAQDHSKDREIAVAGNVEKEISFSELVTSNFKLGGRYRYRDRSYDHSESGGTLNLGSGQNVRDRILEAFPWMKQTVGSGSANLPLTLFVDNDYDFGNFLDGEYPMGPAIDMDLMKEVLGVVRTSGTLEAYGRNDFGSVTSNYSGNEYASAGYVMADVSIGPQVKIIPGIRYEQLRTNYTAPRGVSGLTGSFYRYVHHDTTFEKSGGYWLPMVHVRYKPLDWFDVRFAYTNTLTYPEYRNIIPRIDISTNSVAWNNVDLKPGRSENFDFYLSGYENTIGLLTAGGFLKRIDDLIFATSGKIIVDGNQYEGLGPAQNGYSIATTFNNPNRIDVWGIELDWQTHFWYLPGVLSGLVFNANYTHIFSEAKYPKTDVRTEYLDVPPYVVKTVTDTFYTNRLIFQPNDILNLAIGYDYGGFSIRVSMLYQANIFRAENFWPELRSSTDDYLRWDVSVKQDLPWFGLQVFGNINNLNSARDVDLNEGNHYPTSEQHYGMTIDVGLRWRL